MRLGNMTGEIADILRNPMKEKLARGEVVASMTVRLVHGIETGTDLSFLLAAATAKAREVRDIKLDSHD